MAKFCGNCGNALNDEDRVCGVCGTAFNDSFVKTIGFTDEYFEKKRKIRKGIKLMAVIFIIAIIVIIGMKIISNYTGDRGFVRKVMSAYEDYDIDTLISLTSDVYADYEEFIINELKSDINLNLDYFDDNVGHEYNISYEIDEIYELSEHEKEEILEEIEENIPDSDVNIIKSIESAKIAITAEEDDKTATKYINITMSKEDDNWKILSLD